VHTKNRVDTFIKNQMDFSLFGFDFSSLFDGDGFWVASTHDVFLFFQISSC